MSAQSDEEFRDFMRGRWPAMVRLAYGLTGDQGHPEDVAQAAFARAYASPLSAGAVLGRRARREVIDRRPLDRLQRRRQAGRVGPG